MSKNTWFKSALQLATRLLAFQMTLISQSSAHKASEGSESDDSQQNSSYPNTYGFLSEHVLIDRNQVAPTNTVDLAQYYFTNLQNNPTDFVSLANLNETLTTQFLNEVTNDIPENTKDINLKNWVLEQKIKLIIDFDKDMKAALTWAKKLYTLEPNNEYAIIVLTLDELKKDTITQKLLRTTFNDSDKFYRYATQLQQLKPRHYYSHFFLAKFNLLLIASRPQDDWRFYCMEAINHYAHSLRLCLQHLGHVEDYYKQKEKLEVIYDYSALKNQKIQEIKEHLKYTRSSLAEMFNLIAEEEYKKLPELYTKLLKVDPELKNYLHLPEQYQYESSYNFTYF